MDERMYFINTSTDFGKQAMPLYHHFLRCLAACEKGTTRIFIHADRSAAVGAMVWAAFYREIPYIPVDLANPLVRAAGIFDQVEPRLVFIDRETTLYRESIATLPAELIWEEGDLVLLEIKNGSPTAHPPTLASVLFTSGTTGIPKGVMIPRENTIAFTDWMCAEFGVTEKSRILSVSPLHFDLSVFDFFAPFFHCAALFIPEKNFVMNPLYLAAFIHENKIDTLYATPTWYTLLLQFGKVKKYDFSFVKTVLVAGEPFKTSLAEQLHQTFPGANISNLYGPTETNVCTFHTLDFTQPLPQRSGLISIGKACPYNEVFVDSENTLNVRGKTITLGYWPHNNQAPVYVTGDVVEYSGDRYYYVGRKDSMVKRNGYRIELAEIEACLAQHANVQQVAVTATAQHDSIRITAHLVMSPFDPEALRQHGLRHLPHWMLPDAFQQHENLPLTTTGKTDYRKLAAYGNAE